ncbi:MAG: prepilin-type N-terminal cleavage/methylation domain-containing protein [Victivallales bacterium]|nr:prepilin-type N-terminal cleavage/methylation domain-containing protein [Victivallales bacterium]
MIRVKAKAFTLIELLGGIAIIAIGSLRCPSAKSENRRGCEWHHTCELMRFPRITLLYALRQRMLLNPKGPIGGALSEVVVIEGEITRTCVKILELNVLTSGHLSARHAI